jgi:hypothetical protein
VAKPPSGTAIDTGHALYTGLTAAWLMAENTGTTSADDTGHGHTLTLADSAAWGTAGGETVIAVPSPSGFGSRPLAVSSPFTLSGASSWSVFFRMKMTSDDNSGTFIGDNDDTNNFISFFGSLDQLRVRSSTSTDYIFSVNSLTTEADVAVVYDQPGAKVHLYIDAVEVGTGASVAGNDAALSVDTLADGYSGGNLALVGHVKAGMVWGGRALTPTEVTSLHTDPYTLWPGSPPPPPPATSYTFTGPTSGLVNVASTNFTVTPNGPATETVTPATDGAGSFTPSSVTFDGTAAAKTFTYTPTSTAGTPHTLSVTDSGSLTDPAPLDYAVTSGTITCSLADDTWGRAGTGNWSPTVSGTYTGSPTTIRGRKRLEGGSYGGYFVVDAAPAGGTWTGPVDFPASDVDYELEVSFGNDTAVTDTVTGLGAVKKVVGVVDQSNGAGTGTNNQTARTTPGCSAHKMLKGSTYSDLGDPTQAGSTGSKILHFVNVLGALLGIRFGLVNMAVGGNGITTWGSGGSNYVAAKAAFTTVGGVDVICGFPRESDAAAGTTQAAYEAAGQALIDDLLADFPTIELFVLDDLQTVDAAGGATAPRQAVVRAGIDALVAANPGLAVKAPVQAVPAYPGNDYHWLTDQQLAEVGGLGAAAAYRVLDPAGGGGGSAVFNPLGAGIVRGL